jgi:hypothetical protein
MYANRTAGSTALKRLMTEYRGTIYASSFHLIETQFMFNLELTLNAPEGITAGLFKSKKESSTC